jgi:hypothetical protein
MIPLTPHPTGARYIIGTALSHVRSGILAPATASFTHMLTLVIAGTLDQFESVLCLYEDSSDATKCFEANDVQGNGAYLDQTPALNNDDMVADVDDDQGGACHVESDSLSGPELMLDGVFSSWQACQSECMACGDCISGSGCLYWKWGAACGEWCSLLPSDNEGWPVQFNGNTQVFVGTIPGNGGC